MRFKRLISLVLVAIFITSGLAFANEVTFVVNDQTVDHGDMIVLVNGKLYGCVAEFAQRYGAETEWFENAGLAVVKYGEKYISFKLNATEVIVDNETLTMDAPSITVENRVYAPIHFLIEQFSGNFVWNEQTLTLSLQSEGYTVDNDSIMIPTYTEEDVLWLARIVDVEAGGGSPEQMLAVANVVLNRVKSDSFPGSVYDVIYQEGKYKQFPPAHKESFLVLEPKASSILAAKKALNGENNVEGCLYFNNRPFSGKGDDLYKVIDGEYFYQ